MSALDFFSNIAERVVDLLKPDQNLRDAQWESLQDQYRSRSAFEDDLEKRLHSQLVDPVVQEILIKGVSFDKINIDRALQWPLHRVYIVDASNEDLTIFMPSFDNRNVSNQYFSTSVNASIVSFIRVDDTINSANIFGNGEDISGSSNVSLDSKYSTVTIFTGDTEWVILQSGGDVSGGGSVSNTPTVEWFDISGPADTTHTLSNPPVGDIEVSLRGLELRQGPSYHYMLSGDTVELLVPVDAGDMLNVRYYT